MGFIINQILYSIIGYDIFLSLRGNSIVITVPKNNTYNFSSKVVGYSVGIGKLVVISDPYVFSESKNTSLLIKIIRWLQ